MASLEPRPDIDPEVAVQIRKVIESHPIELEDRLPGLEKPLIIECACPGWQPRTWPERSAYPTKLPAGYEDGGVRFPAVPITLDQQAGEVKQAVKAGCAVTHVHPRDPETGERYKFQSEFRYQATKDEDRPSDHKLLYQLYDRIFAETDAISVQHGWRRNPDYSIDYVTDMEDLLKAGQGNRYCQGAVVLWPTRNSYGPGYTEAVQDGIRYMQAHKVKPFHKIRSAYNLRYLWRALVDTDIMTDEPFVLVHDMGHPFGWPMDSPRWMPLDLIVSIEQTKERIPNSIIGVYSGGRNWLPITITAILHGVDLVRVGIEDCYWMYPHLDEVIAHNIDCVRKITDFCAVIGRRVAGVDEARQILGMERTS